MSIDVYTEGHLFIEPAGSVALPGLREAIDQWNNAGSPKPFLPSVATLDSCELNEQVDGDTPRQTLEFYGWSSWYDDDFVAGLEQWLAECCGRGITIWGTITRQCDQDGHTEERYDADSRRETPLTVEVAEIVWPSDLRFKKAALLDAMMAEWGEWFDSDDPISGGDAVDWITAHLRRYRELA